MSDVRLTTAGGVFSQRIREQWNEQLGRRIDILAAGCGRGAPLELEQIDARVTGVDEDRPALRAATVARPDLDSWSLGDLRSVPLMPRSYDVVCVEFLLERIPHAELVLDRMVNGLRPGGLLLIRMRDRKSAYGFLDRKVPFRGLLWRWLAPKDAIGPLPAIYEPVTSREGVHSYCMMRGLMIAEDHALISGLVRLGPHGGLVAGVCRTVSRLLGGRLAPDHDEIALVVRKPQHHFARLI
ncbi:hypothetical protein GCM10009555_066540 [Acrocarpospora macrocephala]|uniref:Methyltransferase type 11 domain-containing protein n=1 Tax=Acrocarpospora macrocephala TaxID=150177 RepID=A0A5M3WLW6_9ACTN|nr:methyltransferase domain-containing protein [Acrocarpospora macrocephala]GES09149.1 hypothetical protein Amac_027450 [Acrocarpospora macrocephala]